MCALAVVAVLTTIPLWAPPTHLTTSDGVFMVAAAVPAGVPAVRTGALVLVVLLGVLTFVRGRRVAVLYAVPALASSWVWWQTKGGGSYTVALEAGDAPSPVASPWFAVAVASTLLVVVSWALTLLGARTLRGARSTGRRASR